MSTYQLNTLNDVQGISVVRTGKERGCSYACSECNWRGELFFDCSHYRYLNEMKHNHAILFGNRIANSGNIEQTLVELDKAKVKI